MTKEEEEFIAARGAMSEIGVVEGELPALISIMHEQLRDAAAEILTLRRHLQYSETRRCKHAIATNPAFSSPSALRAQVSGLLSQVKDLGEERKVLRKLAISEQLHTQIVQELQNVLARCIPLTEEIAIREILTKLRAVTI